MMIELPRNDDENVKKIKLFHEKLSKMFAQITEKNKQKLEEKVIPVINIRSCLLSPACLISVTVIKAPTDGAYAFEYDNPHLTGPSNKIKVFLN